MSKGWYVKVETNVVFRADTNIGVVASCEREAMQEAAKIVRKEIRTLPYSTLDLKNIPWDFKIGALECQRSGEAYVDESYVEPVHAEVDPDFDPDPVTDVQGLMEAAQCLNECFHDLPKDHELVKWREDNGIAATRDQINLCAVMCEQTHKIMLDKYEYDDCYDWDFCPKFLEYCVDYEKFEPKSDNPQHLVNMFRVGVQCDNAHSR